MPDDKYNQELMNALMNPPKREPWAWTKDYPTLAEFLRQSLQYVPLGFSFRGPIMTGRPAGLTMGDFSKAADTYAATRPGMQPRFDPGVTGGAALEEAWSTPTLRELAGDTPTPIRNPLLHEDPYDAAVAMQALARRTANSK